MAIVLVAAIAIAAGAVLAVVATQPSVESAKAQSDDPTGYSIVVNKRRPLPADFVPRDLVTVNVPHTGEDPRLQKKAARAVEELFAAFTEETGLRMRSNSAYRSFRDQQAEYKKFAQTLGESEALETTAKPGFSEHQTGLAIDIGAVDAGCDARACFAATEHSRWLQQNAWRFGFIIRYPRGQESVTGYTYEPWHLRYVGPRLAKKIHGHYSSLEAYFGLPPAPTY